MCILYAVQCTMYIYFVHTFYIHPSIPYYLCVQCNVYTFKDLNIYIYIYRLNIYIYTGYTIQICCVCEYRDVVRGCREIECEYREAVGGCRESEIV